MKNYFEDIRKKLNKEIEIESIEIVDNSYKHKGHKYFSSEKFHLHLKIKSLYLNSISKWTFLLLSIFSIPFQVNLLSLLHFSYNPLSDC